MGFSQRNKDLNKRWSLGLVLLIAVKQHRPKIYVGELRAYKEEQKDLYCYTDKEVSVHTVIQG